MIMGLNELEIPYLLVDFRGINPNSRMDVYKRIEGSLNEFFRKNKEVWRALKDNLKNISRVSVMGFGISLS
ncbi:hypothetical protein [Thermococcus sp. Bubb.Bath]|uniref:hypothetical protein n=1 Tax=Thermococcus sp. Bubb.Bath TaxID=1638242 RepID=UPI001F0CE77A|nr:hypothetical protein [Thermococcus sp. Bubb.Bath]